MSKMSISEAARQAGISRQYFYSKYINTGSITVSVDESGNKYIDDSELLRVFDGRLPATKIPSRNDSINDGLPERSGRQQTSANETKITALQTEVDLLREQLRRSDEQMQKTEERYREQLQDYKAREARLLDQVDSLTNTIKQIEHRPADQQPVQAPPPPTPRRGFFARLFGGRS